MARSELDKLPELGWDCEAGASLFPGSCASGGVLLGDCASFGSASRNQTGHNIANLPFSFAATIN